MAFTITAKALDMAIGSHDKDMVVKESIEDKGVLFASILHGDNMLQKFLLKEQSFVSMELDGKSNVWQKKVIQDFVGSIRGEQEVRVISDDKLTIEVNNMLGLKVSEFSGAFVLDNKGIEKSIDKFKPKKEDLDKMCRFKMRFIEFKEFVSRVNSVLDKGSAVFKVEGKKLMCAIDERTYNVENTHYLDDVSNNGLVKLNRDYLNTFTGLKIDSNVECNFYVPNNNNFPFMIEIKDSHYDYSCAIAPRVDMT